ncbi:MAG TPA: DEAD/DEAH box helicase [Gammaproteobacteria bacterium]
MQASSDVNETPSEANQHLTDLKFSELPLSVAIQRGIAEAGFERCTPIQAKALPLALAGRDVAGQAQTGTGKTAAYLIALYQKLESTPALQADRPAPRALVLAPTRELAVQIHADASVLGKHLPYKLGLAFGGTDYEKQRQQLAAGVDVLIGTPGRIIDYFKQRVFGLRRVQVMVLDEADRMFDLGFIKDIRYVLRRLPEREKRLNLLFSATLSYRVLELAYEHMNDPELVRIDPDKMTVDRVKQTIYFPSNEEKLPLLLTLLRDMDARRTMVFVNRRREADRLRDALVANGIQAEALSGDVPQRKRLAMLRDFQGGKLPVLIATDVASRGLHVPGVSHVFNYDLPQDPEDYVHRIGRTARAGAEGDAISFGCEDYVMSLPDIEAFIGHKIPVATIDPERLVKPVEAPRSRPERPRGPRPEGRRDGAGKRGGRRKRRGRSNERAAHPEEAAAPLQPGPEPAPEQRPEPPPASRPEPAEADAPPPDGGRKRRKRRRRRRKKSGEPAPPPTPPSS